MLSYIILLVLISFSSTFTLIQPRQSLILNEIDSLISSEHCQFYTSLNRKFQCGRKSHLLQYSYKYCQLLLNIRDTFDNSRYQDSVRVCLQQKLITKIKQIGETNIKCDSLKQIDLESHGNCFSLGFKELSAHDIKQFLTTFKDTTINYSQLCKMANSFAGHWSQLVKGDLMIFIKTQLKEIFPDGDITQCTIKEREIIDEIDEVILQMTSVVEKLKEAKDVIVLIIDKSKIIHDDLRTIRDIIEGMKSGTISQIDGLTIILAKSESIVGNAKIIIEIIKNLNKEQLHSEDREKENEMDTMDLMQFQLAQILSQFDILKEEIYKIITNVDVIRDTMNEINNGEKDLSNGFSEIMNMVVEPSIDHIYSIMTMSHTLKESIIELIDSFAKGLEGLINIDKKTIDSI